MGRVFTNCLGDLRSIPSCLIPKTLKMVLDTSLLNTQWSRVKWSNPGKGVAPSPTPQCRSYWKGSLLVAPSPTTVANFIIHIAWLAEHKEIQKVHWTELKTICISKPNKKFYKRNFLIYFQSLHVNYFCQHIFWISHRWLKTMLIFQ